MKMACNNPPLKSRAKLLVKLRSPGCSILCHSSLNQIHFRDRERKAPQVKFDDGWIIHKNLFTQPSHEYLLNPVSLSNIHWLIDLHHTNLFS